MKHSYASLYNLKSPGIFKKLFAPAICFILLSGFNNNLFADVTVTTATTAAGNISQGTSNNIIYAAQLSVTTTAVTVNNIQFAFSGTQDATDISNISIYFNPTAPTIAGASLLNNTSGAFAAGHVYTVSFSNAITAGNSGYYIIAVNLTSDATDNNTIKINGATAPVVFGFTTSPTVTNSQTDAAGIQTIQAADATITTATMAAGNINQGTSYNIIYAAQLSVTTTGLTVNNIQFAFSGTEDASDITTVSILFNPAAPTIAGASLLNNTAGTFAAGHVYSISFSNAIAAGGSGYYIIAVNLASDATDNNTIRIDGATAPVVFGFTTSPNINNNQSGAAGIQTIQAADVTVTTATLAAGNINQGTSYNIIYAAQVSAAVEPVNVNNIQFAFSGTQDANDITNISILFNPTAPTIAGASLLNNASGAFAAGHVYNITFSTALTAGSSGYFIITVNLASDATDNNTIRIDGSAGPVVLGFTTSPNINNNQSGAAGIQTIQAADATISTVASSAANILQGSSNNIIYAAQMSITTEPVNVNNIQFAFSGTQDANDITNVSIFFNPTAPTIAGASLLNNNAGTFAAGHIYNIPFSIALTTGSSGYFIIAVNLASDATDNNTININGATNPVVFGFTTSPNINNSQANIAGIQTIQAAGVVLSTAPVAASIFSPGSGTNIVYITQMAVAGQPVVVNNIQFTLHGTFTATDLTGAAIYYNPTTPGIAGASLLNNTSAAFAPGHLYSVSFSNSMAVGVTGYYIITVNVSATANIGNTVTINGATDPVVFGFTTSPNVINNQTDGSLHTLPVTFVNVTVQAKTTYAEVDWKVANQLNIDKYIVERSADARLFTPVGEKKATGNSATIITYTLPDEAPLAGNSFYRIGAVNKDGRVTYSPIVKATVKGKEAISIYPNPVVKNGQLTLQLQNLQKDNYNIEIFNNQGQQVLKQTIEHNGGSSVQTIQLPKITTGIYYIRVNNQVLQMSKPFTVQ